ncbi:MAG: STAS domain-containing protein [Nitrospinae bacterium]|nr:STAS domain-containing protein [Nitrospinota bacterium]
MHISNIVEIPDCFAVKAALSCNLMKKAELEAVEEFVLKNLKKRNVHIIFDFENVERMNSTALGNLSMIYKDIAEQKGSLYLYNVDEIARRTMEITCFTHIIKIFNTYDEVVAAIKG